MKVTFFSTKSYDEQYFTDEGRDSGCLHSPLFQSTQHFTNEVTVAKMKHGVTLLKTSPAE